MKGLFYKDIRLLFARKRNLLIFMAVLLIMGYSVDMTFLVGYGTMLFGIFTISTLSYDEFDNGMPYLMTLPITPRDYVKEKFLFSGLGVVFGWLVSLTVGAAMGFVRGEPVVFKGSAPEILGMLVMFLAIVGILLAVELKFGIERSRTIMMVLGGGVFAVGIIGSKLLPDRSPAFFSSLSNAPDALILAVITGISVVILLAAFVFSCRVMENRQY